MPLPELPNNPFGDDFGELCRFIDQFDLVIVQRCYKYEVVRIVKAACEVMGRKMVFETDDDYFHIPPSNPCYAEMNKPGVLNGYAHALTLADLVTVSTKELKDVIYRFNKNVVVLQNNVETVLSGTSGAPAKAYGAEVVDSSGKLVLNAQHGLVSVPSYYVDKAGKKQRVLRIGYSGTPTHREDFETIKFAFEKLLKKYSHKIWLVYIGDKYFAEKTENASGRLVHIPISQYDLYRYHLRNIDIGIAPLQANVFNMSKSPIKALEYGMWGIPAVLPNYVTYTRAFTHGENCMTYYNGQEFYECLEELIHNNELREKLGANARDLVANNYVEALHADKRMAAYQEVMRGAEVKRFATV